MDAPAQDPRDVVIARVIVGAAVLGAAWLVARSPRARRLVCRGARYAAVTWLPAFVAGQVRGAWAASAPPPAPSPAQEAGPDSQAPPAVAAFVPPVAGPG
jgi:hypothetical protein